MGIKLLPPVPEGKGRRRKWLLAGTVAGLIVLTVLAYPYTYGEKGDLRLTVTVNPGPYRWDLRGQVVVGLTLENVGTTTVRVVPLALRFEVAMTDPNGTHVPSFFDLAGDPLYAASDLVEVPEGGALTMTYPLTNGGFVMNATGLYTVTAEYSMSAPLMGGSSPPYWKGTVESTAASFNIVP